MGVCVFLSVAFSSRRAATTPMPLHHSQSYTPTPPPATTPVTSFLSCVHVCDLFLPEDVNPKRKQVT